MSRFFTFAAAAGLVMAAACDGVDMSSPAADPEPVVKTGITIHGDRSIEVCSWAESLHVYRGEGASGSYLWGFTLLDVTDTLVITAEADVTPSPQATLRIFARDKAEGQTFRFGALVLEFPSHATATYAVLEGKARVRDCGNPRPPIRAHISGRVVTRIERQDPKTLTAKHRRWHIPDRVEVHVCRTPPGRGCWGHTIQAAEIDEEGDVAWVGDMFATLGAGEYSTEVKAYWRPETGPVFYSWGWCKRHVGVPAELHRGETLNIWWNTCSPSSHGPR